MRALQTLVAVIFLSACGGSVKKVGDGGPTSGGGPSKNYREVTQTGTCSGTPTHRSPIGAWKRQFIGDQGDNVEVTYDIGQNSTVFAKTCRMDKVTIVTSMRVNTTISANHFIVLQNVDHTETQEISGQTFACQILVPSGSYGYRLDGNCFGLVANARVMYFTP